MTALTTVIVPKSGGVTSTKAVVVRWLKREGDRVKAGDPLVELETEKVGYELEWHTYEAPGPRNCRGPGWRSALRGRGIDSDGCKNQEVGGSKCPKRLQGNPLCEKPTLAATNCVGCTRRWFASANSKNPSNVLLSNIPA